MKIQVRDALSLSFGFVLASPVLVMIASLVWAWLTPINVESEWTKTGSTIHRSIHVQGNANPVIEFDEPIWTFSGQGWAIGFERKAKCFVHHDNLPIRCLRYGWPIFEADLIAMYRPYREAERQRLILEEAAKSGQRI